MAANEATAAAAAYAAAQAAALDAELAWDAARAAARHARDVCAAAQRRRRLARAQLLAVIGEAAHG
ncbi:MAG: hypothetical protein CMO30_24595 [Tistrella sp.]|uniref:Uncharacterized protein n=1 Tax=Tistrella mobilis TaxID=171437 RepID=A0A3B9ID88_9PROT|nr:hypothetical protein [Tistrella sp.]MAD35468.1 hypothetical protein [Tistrella sp.]MBA78459.1 hypothetical protein [Tistrella sp.]HAE45834.1 hypothetical protein [Tistrella mobilis]